MLNYIEFYGDGLGRDVISADSPNIQVIEGNRRLRVGKSSPKSGDDRIGPVFVYVIAGSNGFERVRAGSSGLVRKAACHARVIFDSIRYKIDR